MSAAAILLAAGAGRRFGGSKLTAPLGGDLLVVRVARALLGGGCDELVVVVGAHADEVSSALCGLPVTTVANPRWDAGMFTSVKTGLSAVRSTADLLAITPADLPGLTAADVRRTLDAASAHPGLVVVPVCGGRRGHPLVFPAALAERLLAWPDQRRLSDLLREPDVRLLEVEGFGEGIRRDVDTPGDLEAQGR